MVPRPYLAASALAAALLLFVALLWLTAPDPPRSGSTIAAGAPAPGTHGAASPETSTSDATERIAAARAPAIETPLAHSLRFAVRHADGAPAPDIALAVRRAPGGSQIFHVTTDAVGEAHIADARAALLEAAASSLIEVAVLGLLPEPTPLPLDPHRCFEEPIAIELPPLSELALRVVRADGSPLGYGSAEVMTQASLGGKPPRGVGLQSFPWWLEVEGGGARFRRIQAEVPLFVAVRDAGWGLELVRALPGLPRGRRAELELRFDVQRHLTRVRVIDGGSGAPLAATHLRASWITVEPQGSSSQGFGVTTDAQGVFYFLRAARENALELALEVGEPRLGLVRRAVPLGLGDGLHDLGDLVIQPDAPRVTGRVVDPGGAPVPHAEIETRVIVGQPEDTARIRFEHFAARLYADENGAFAWNAPPISSDPLVGERAWIELTANDATRRSRTERVRVGARDVELRLAPLGSFVGRLTIDPQVPFYVLVLEYRRAGHEPESSWTRSYARAETHLEVNGLESGLYDFRARLEATEEGAAVVPGIEVRAGERTLDPRLDPLDLRAAFAVFDFEIAHPPECLPYDLRFWLTRVAGGGELRIRGSMVSATRAATFAPAGTYDAVFETPGFHPVVLRGLTAGQRVELRPAHALRLGIDLAAVDPRAPGTLELVLRRSDTQQELVRPIDPANPELAIPLSQPGRYDLVWRRRTGSGESSTLVPLGPGDPAFLEVAPTAAETAARIAPPR